MAKPREFETIGSRRQVILLHDKLFPLYIVKGEKNYLIDSGPAVFGDIFYDRICRAVSGGIHTLLLTHSHWDHTGAAHYLQQKFGFNVMASDHAVKLLEKSKVVGFIDRLNRGYAEMMDATSDIPFDQLENLVSLKEGDTIRIDGESYIEVIETPGHTKCSISYLLHPDGILFHGDTAGLRERGNRIKPLFLSDYSEYERSLQKLIQLDAAVLAFPHNRIISGREKVRKYLEDSLAATRSFKEEIRTLLEKEPDITKAAETLYESESSATPLLGPRESYIINIEAMIKAVRQSS
jgi:glyoxylase-like metal-dependent hydrolase (beta-lactamase superfamily II)